MSSDSWKKEHTTLFSLRFTNASGIPIAIAKAAEEQGATPVEYIKAVLRKQLITDGYLSDDEPKED